MQYINSGGSFLIYLDMIRYEYITLTPRECSRNMDTPKEEDGHCWYYGDLFKLKIVLSPDSIIAAIHFDDEIRIYYQGKFYLDSHNNSI